MHFIIYDADHHIESSFEQAFHGGITHSAGDDAVNAGRRTAALDMAENADLGINIRKPLFHHFRYFLRAAEIVTFRYHNQVHELFSFFFFLEGTDQFFDIRFPFRDEDVFRAGGDAAVEGNITGIATHHFNHKKPVVRIRSIADLVYRLDSRIHGGIKTDGKIGARNVFVNGAGKADTGNLEFGTEFMRAPEGSVAANDNKPVYTQLLQIGIRPGTTLVFEKLFAAGGL